MSETFNFKVFLKAFKIGNFPLIYFQSNLCRLPLLNRLLSLTGEGDRDWDRDLRRPLLLFWLLSKDFDLDLDPELELELDVDSLSEWPLSSLSSSFIRFARCLALKNSYKPNFSHPSLKKTNKIKINNYFKIINFLENFFVFSINNRGQLSMCWITIFMSIVQCNSILHK